MVSKGRPALTSVARTGSRSWTDEILRSQCSTVGSLRSAKKLSAIKPHTFNDLQFVGQPLALFRGQYTPVVDRGASGRGATG